MSKNGVARLTRDRPQKLSVGCSRTTVVVVTVVGLGGEGPSPGPICQRSESVVSNGFTMIYCPGK